jgi:hypothetical protein
MKLSEFMLLTQEEKRSTVLQEGVPIAKMEILNYMVFLFQLPNYYVEAYCCQESKEIREYRVFHKAEHLTPYLEAIPLEQLLKK